MEGHCSTSQSPQWAVVPMEEEEDKEEEEEDKEEEEELSENFITDGRCVPFGGNLHFLNKYSSAFGLLSIKFQPKCT